MALTPALDDVLQHRLTIGTRPLRRAKRKRSPRRTSDLLVVRSGGLRGADRDARFAQEKRQGEPVTGARTER